MRKKRTIFGNRKIHGYVTLPEFFETPNGKELWEYLKLNKPLCLIFLTRGGYVVDVEFKKFMDIENHKSVMIEKIKNGPVVPIDAPFKMPPKEKNPIFERPADPVERILEPQSEPDEPSEDEQQLKVGYDVKYKENGVIFIGTVVSINEASASVTVEQNGSIHTVKLDNLIAIV